MKNELYAAAGDTLLPGDNQIISMNKKKFYPKNKFYKIQQKKVFSLNQVG